MYDNVVSDWGWLFACDTISIPQMKSFEPLFAKLTQLKITILQRNTLQFNEARHLQFC